MIKKDYLLRQLSTLLQAIVDKYTLVPCKTKNSTTSKKYFPD